MFQILFNFHHDDFHDVHLVNFNLLKKRIKFYQNSSTCLIVYWPIFILFLIILIAKVSTLWVLSGIYSGKDFYDELEKYILLAGYSLDAFLTVIFFVCLGTVLILIWQRDYQQNKSDLTEDEIINLVNMPQRLPTKFIICSFLFLFISLFMIMQRFANITLLFIEIFNSNNEFKGKFIFQVTMCISRYFFDFLFCLTILIFHFNKADLKTIEDNQTIGEENENLMGGYDDIQGE
jgi:hypothetical protein